jgi:hypothetical protein
MNPPEHDFGARHVGSAVQPCPLAPQGARVHWIEIVLLGEDGRPLPWELYSVVLPCGECVTGYLDDKGQARIANIATPGECQVSFPLLDGAAWERT